MSQIPRHIVLSTLGVSVGVLVTWSQVDSLTSWTPTLVAQLGMALVAIGAVLGMGRPLRR